MSALKDEINVMTWMDKKIVSGMHKNKPIKGDVEEVFGGTKSVLKKKPTHDDHVFLFEYLKKN